MRLTLSNVRRWAAANDYEPRAYTGPRTLRDFIHDNTWACEACSDRFTDAADLGDDGWCAECVRGDWPVVFSARENGTYRAYAGSVAG